MDDQPRLSADGSLAQDNAATILSFFTDVLGGPAGLQKVHAYVAPGILDHDPSSGAAGLAGVVAKLQALWSAYPDGSFAVSDIIAAGDCVATRSAFRGTLAAASGGAAGQRVTVPFADFYRLRDGLIVEHAHVVDAAAFGRAAGA